MTDARFLLGQGSTETPLYYILQLRRWTCYLTAIVRFSSLTTGKLLTSPVVPGSAKMEDDSDARRELAGAEGVLIQRTEALLF